MAPTKDFEGDEFSNNLFSDLAPLLTLFGEQVTKQFVCMSMGWTDDVLLAMGPLGIITIIVSAVRVGGGRKLKALIGRARESQSTAEQELLSSTSTSVCEMWNGQQVIRLVGHPSKMRNLLVSLDGEVFTLEHAFLEGLIDIMEKTQLSPWLGFLRKRENTETIRNLRHSPMENSSLPSGLRVALAKLESISNLAPNLTLNSRNATTSSEELWLWARLGYFLQVCAIVFAGVSTYHWKFKKAGNPVAPYGYPCFAIGTGLLTVGIILCGHIIEGVTTEHEFFITSAGTERGLRFFSLQEAQLLGDQAFPHTIIFPAKNDESIRLSRLNQTDYRFLAALATGMSVLGYIAQFVGLRSLHWSATIFQLGVTLILTSIRAWVRRGLASGPNATSALDLKGHDLAWTTLQVMSGIGPSPGSDVMKKSRRRFSMFYVRVFGCIRRAYRKVTRASSLATSVERRGDHYSSISQHQFFWELISEYSEGSNDTSPSSQESEQRPDPTFVNNQFFSRIRGPLSLNLKWLLNSVAVSSDNTTAQAVDPLNCFSVNFFSYISQHFSRTKTADEVVEASKALCSAIERSMELFRRKSSITWKPQFLGININSGIHAESHTLVWDLNVTECDVEKYDHTTRTDKRFFFQLQKSGNRYSNLEQNRAHFEAALSLSTYSDAFRKSRVTNPTNSLGILGHPYQNKRFKRIVGYGKKMDELSQYSNILSKWLDQPVLQFDLTAARNQSLQGRTDIEENSDSPLEPEGLLSAFLQGRTNREENSDSPLEPEGLLSAFDATLRKEFPLVVITQGLELMMSFITSSTEFWKRLTRLYKLWRWRRNLGAEVRQDLRILTEMRTMENASAFLGMFLSSASELDTEISSSDCFEELYIPEHSGTSKTLQYAQEIFSLFILGLASQTEKVNGDTVITESRRRHGVKRCENSVFKSVAQEVVNAKLAQDVEEAYTLIIPAFAKYNLLPPDADDEGTPPSTDPAHLADPTTSLHLSTADLEGQQTMISQQDLTSQQDLIPQQPSSKQVPPLGQESDQEEASPVNRHSPHQSHVFEPSAAQTSEETSSLSTEPRSVSVRRANF